MKTTATFINVGEMEVAVTTTMRLKDWITLTEQLKESQGKWPAWKIANDIGDVIYDIQQTFYKNEAKT